MKRTAAKHRSEEMYNHPSQTVYLPVLIIPDVVAFVKLYMKKPCFHTAYPASLGRVPSFECSRLFYMVGFPSLIVLTCFTW